MGCAKEYTTALYVLPWEVATDSGDGHGAAVFGPDGGLAAKFLLLTMPATLLTSVPEGRGELWGHISVDPCLLTAGMQRVI